MEHSSWPEVHSPQLSDTLSLTMIKPPKYTPWSELHVTTLYRLFLEGAELIEIADELQRPTDDVLRALNGLNLLATKDGHYHRVHPTPFAPCSQPTAPSPKHELTVADLELPIRCFNVLKNSDIHTVLQLCERTTEDLLRLPNMGRRSVREIIEALEDRGYKLQPSS